MRIIAQRQAEMSQIVGAVHRLGLTAEDRILYACGILAAFQPLDELGEIPGPDGLSAAE